MAKSNYKPEEIAGYLRDIEILQGKGKTASEACRELGISEAADYRWEKQYGTMQVNEVKCLTSN